MPKPTRPRKRSSSTKPSRKPAPKKRRSPQVGKRKAPKKRKAQPSKRSTAAKKGWATRRKKKRLLDAMVDLKMRRDAEAQPLGWQERRLQLRFYDNKLWRKIEVTFDQKIVDAKRLETLKALEIDMLPAHELRDYLEWVADEADLDLSDTYRMYLGYPLEDTLSA